MLDVVRILRHLLLCARHYVVVVHGVAKADPVQLDSQNNIGDAEYPAVVVLGLRPYKQVELLGENLELAVRPVEVGVGECQLGLLGRVIWVEGGVHLQLEGLHRAQKSAME